MWRVSVWKLHSDEFRLPAADLALAVWWIFWLSFSIHSEASARNEIIIISLGNFHAFQTWEWFNVRPQNDVKWAWIPEFWSSFVPKLPKKMTKKEKNPLSRHSVPSPVIVNVSQRITSHPIKPPAIVNNVNCIACRTEQQRRENLLRRTANNTQRYTPHQRMWFYVRLRSERQWELRSHEKPFSFVSFAVR